MNFLEAALKKAGNFNKIINHNGLIRATIERDISAEDLNKLLFENNISLSHLVKKRDSLEEQFLELVK